MYSVNHYSTTLKVHRTRTTLDDDIFPGPPWRATLLLGTNLWKANICTWERFALNGSILKTQNNLMPPDAKNCRTDHTVWKLYNFPFHNFMLFFLLSIFMFLQNYFILPIFVAKKKFCKGWCMDLFSEDTCPQQIGCGWTWRLSDGWGLVNWRLGLQVIPRETMEGILFFRYSICRQTCTPRSNLVVYR